MEYPKLASPYVTDPALTDRDRRRLTRGAAATIRISPHSILWLAAPASLATWVQLYDTHAPALARAAATLAVPVVILLALRLAGRLARGLRDASASAAHRRHHGAAVRVGDLSQPARDLLRRARAAVWSVHCAAVCQDGHLGDQSALLEAEWHIARTLRDMTSLQAAHETITSHDHTADPCVSAVAAPQRQILAQVTGSITSRVRQLEDYARRVAAADTAYRTWQTASALAGLNEPLLDLLAATAGAGTLDGELTAMTFHAQAAHETFRASVDEARACALAIPPDPDRITAGA